MFWYVTTPLSTFVSRNGSVPAGIEIIEDFIAEYDNLIPWQYPAVYPYKRSDPIAVFMAAKFYAESQYPDDSVVQYEGFEIPTVKSDAPADAVF